MTGFRETVPTPAQLVRNRIRAGLHKGPTAGLAPGYVQANVVIVPEAAADEFETFCRYNAQACPIIRRQPPGDPYLNQDAFQADIRTDVPRYRVFRHGVLEPREPTDIRHLWRPDLVTFLIGCSFTFEHALLEAGLPVRHIEQGRNVPMYRTNVPCRPAGPFAGPLVVSMRPYRPSEVEQVRQVTARYTRMHGAPVHVGDPEALGIADLALPDFGDSVTVYADEVPVFWACGVTPQLAMESAQLELAITHSPGCMFITDRLHEHFRD